MKPEDYITQFKKHLIEGDFAIEAPSINLYADSLEVDDIIDAMTRAELVAYFRMILSNGLKKLAIIPDCNPFPIDFDNPPKIVFIDCDVAWARHDEMIVAAFNPLTPMETLQKVLKHYFKFARDIAEILKNHPHDPTKPSVIVGSTVPNPETFKNLYAHSKMRDEIRPVEDEI